MATAKNGKKGKTGKAAAAGGRRRKVASTKRPARKAGPQKVGPRRVGPRKVGTRKAGTRKSARGPSKMKAYASFDLYLADQPPAHQQLIRALREFVARKAPQLQEAVKWGNGCWLLGRVPISYVYAAVDYVQFGFVRGSALRDPRGLLHGDGQYVRHIKVHSLADIDEDAFSALFAQAVG